MPEMQPDVVLRMGTHAEKEYILKTLRFLDGVIIGANLLEATQGATASLLLKIAGKREPSIPYYIDPMTYAFGAYDDPTTGQRRSDLDWIKSERTVRKRRTRDFKRSYRKLAEALGSPFADALTRSTALDASDFTTAVRVAQVCGNVLEYQRTRVASIFANDPDYAGFVDDVPGPAVLFAPYFFIERRNTGQLVDLSIRLIAASREQQREQPVHGVFCADESFLRDAGLVQRLIAELPSTGVSGVWLWFSTFREEEADIATLSAFRSVVESLSSSMHVFNMHGGFFSLGLSKRGLAGVSHGVGYGEQKDVVPVIGQSTPTVRYYLPPTHRRLGVPQIERCFDALGIKTPADFFAKICDCVVCKGVIVKSLADFSSFGDTKLSTVQSKRLAQTPAAAKRCRFHFLVRRISERDWVRSAELPDILAQLLQAGSTWGQQPAIASQATHLARWVQALR
jgi:hypothetical protein